MTPLPVYRSSEIGSISPQREQYQTFLSFSLAFSDMRPIMTDMGRAINTEMEKTMLIVSFVVRDVGNPTESDGDELILVDDDLTDAHWQALALARAVLQRIAVRKGTSGPLAPRCSAAVNGPPCLLTFCRHHHLAGRCPRCLPTSIDEAAPRPQQAQDQPSSRGED